MVQLSHPYLTTGKAIALTRRTFVGILGRHNSAHDSCEVKKVEQHGDKNLRLRPDFIMS